MILLEQFNWTNTSSSTRGLNGSHDDAQMSCLKDDCDRTDNAIEASAGKLREVIISMFIIHSR